MEKTIVIDGKNVRMRASALIPRIYRVKFRRDMIADMAKLQKNFDKAKKAIDDPNATEEELAASQLSALDLTIFENVAWLMIKHAGEDAGDSPEEWLDSISGVFSVYEVLPSILELWNLSQATTSVPRKK